MAAWRPVRASEACSVGAFPRDAACPHHFAHLIAHHVDLLRLYLVEHHASHRDPFL